MKYRSIDIFNDYTALLKTLAALIAMGGTITERSLSDWIKYVYHEEYRSHTACYTVRCKNAVIWVYYVNTRG